MKHLPGKAILYRRTDMKLVKFHRTELSLSASEGNFALFPKMKVSGFEVARKAMFGGHL